MQKILFAGDISGNLDYLISKVELLLKNNEFKALFCVGSTFSINMDLSLYIKGEKKIPIPTYVLDSSELSLSLNELFPDGSEICKNLHFLGKSGVKEIDGLTIAYINGLKNKISSFNTEEKEFFSGGYYTLKEINKLKTESDGKSIDIFLSCEWPYGFERGILEYPKNINKSSIHIANLVDYLCPRYHIVGLEGIFYQRRPYTNEKGFITRLIGLGAVPEKSDDAIKKEKFLHALQITPIPLMDKTTLFAITADTTENPFKIAENKLISKDFTEINEQQEFLKKEQLSQINELKENCKLFVKGFDFKTRDDEIEEFLSRWGRLKSLEIVYDHKSKRNKGYAFCQFIDIKETKQALSDNNKYSLAGRLISFSISQSLSQSQGMQPITRDDCWFCLGNTKIEKSLIFYLGNELYLSLDKGPITEKHLQIIPIQHFGSTIMLPINVSNEIKNIKNKIVEIFKSKYSQSVIFYERSVKIRFEISHMVMHCIPFRSDNMEKLMRDFDDILRKKNMEFFKLKENEEINDFVKEDEFFVYFELRLGITTKYLFCYKENQQHLYSYDIGRTVICELFKWENKINWKNCIIEEDFKRDTVSELKKKFC